MDVAQALDVLEQLVADAVEHRARRCTPAARAVIATGALQEYSDAVVVLLRRAGAPTGPAPAGSTSSLPTG